MVRRHGPGAGGVPMPAGGPMPWRWVALLVGYLALVVALQAAVSPTLELDQSEQLVLSQRLQWGYTNQPPLYTWLVWGLATLSGSGLLALWTVKVLLLTAFVLACDGAARCLGLDARQRQVAVAGLALVPAFIWEAQRDLTHSLLAAALAAAVLWSALDSLSRPAWWRDVRTGLLAAGALLAKHNAAIFLTALPLALMASPVTRAQWRWRSLLTVGGVMALACAPHGAWLAAHPESLNRTLEKVQGTTDAGGVMAGAALALLGFLTPWWLLALPMWWQARRVTDASRFLVHLALAVAGCLMLFALALGVDHVHPRWYFPQLFFAPLWLAAAIDPGRPAWRGRISWRHHTLALGAVLAVMVALALPGRVLWPHAKATRQNLPYADLARKLQAQWGQPVPPVVLSSHHLLAANLKLAWGGAVRVWAPVMPGRLDLPADVMLVARPEDLASPRFGAWLALHTGLSPAEVHWVGSVSAPPYHRPHDRPVVLQWARVPTRPSP